MIDASSFRDKAILSVSVSYDWQQSMHFAEVKVSGHDGQTQTYRVSGLSGVNVREDFAAMHIEQCTLTLMPGRVYLSLDPFIEGTESERDNFAFTGAEISVIR